jgi:hypothetical protein
MARKGELTGEEWDEIMRAAGEGAQKALNAKLKEFGREPIDQAKMAIKCCWCWIVRF